MNGQHTGRRFPRTAEGLQRHILKSGEFHLHLMSAGWRLVAYAAMGDKELCGTDCCLRLPLRREVGMP